MIGTIISLLRPATQLLRHSPQIIGAAKAITPDSWKGTLNKVEAQAGYAGLALGVTEALTPESALEQLFMAGLTWAEVPFQVSMPSAHLLAFVTAYVGGALGGKFIGWARQEDGVKLSQVKPR